MFRKIITSRAIRQIAFGVVCMIIAAVITTFALSNQLTKAQAAGPANSPQAPSSGVWRDCVISNIMVAGDRIHVQCTTAASDGTQFYAIHADAAHQIKADRILTMFTTAFSAGKNLDVQYETDTTYNPPGCLTTNCRFIKAVIIH